MRRSPADAESQDDELLDGVVRTVTAQADPRDQTRRRARQFNRKSRKLTYINGRTTEPSHCAVRSVLSDTNARF